MNAKNDDGFGPIRSRNPAHIPDCASFRVPLFTHVLRGATGGSAATKDGRLDDVAADGRALLLVAPGVEFPRGVVRFGFVEAEHLEGARERGECELAVS